MAKAHTGHARRGWGGVIGHGVLELIKRVYAIAMIVLVAWLSFRALLYLVNTLIVPSPAPEQITGIPKRLDREVFETPPTEWLGVQISEHPRVPLAHYHRIDGWFQLDQFSGCTASGCHNPLPHSRRKEDRAFLNMHATSMHCSVCHMTSETTPLPLVWYSLETGAPTETPALLQLYGWLNSPEGQAGLAQPTYEFQQRFASLLSLAADQADGDPDLLRMLLEIEAPRYSSAQFEAAAQAVYNRLPRHFRGEYGAKLALKDAAGGGPLLDHPNNDEAVALYRGLPAAADSARRDAILERVHTRRRPQTLQCTACHRAEESLVNLASVGYPPQRIQSLQQGFIFGAIEHLLEGRPLYLPGFAAPEGGATAPPPANLPPPNDAASAENAAPAEIRAATVRERAEETDPARPATQPAP